MPPPHLELHPKQSYSQEAVKPRFWITACASWPDRSPVVSLNYESPFPSLVVDGLLGSPLVWRLFDGRPDVLAHQRDLYVALGRIGICLNIGIVR